MSENAKHASTPWEKWEGHAAVFAEVKGNSNSRSCISGRRVAEFDDDEFGNDDDEGREIAMANAAFVVLAVNNHDDLLVALRDILTRLPEYLISPLDVVAVSKAWKAVEKAEQAQ